MQGGAATLLKAGDATDWVLPDGVTPTNFRAAVRGISGGANVKLEKKADGSVPDASATSVTDISSDQQGTSVAAAESSGNRYRLRLTVAPSAGGAVHVNLTKESTALAA